MYEIYSPNNGTMFCRDCPSTKRGTSTTRLLTVLTDLREFEGGQPWLSWLTNHSIDWKVTTNSLETFTIDYPEYFI